MLLDQKKTKRMVKIVSIIAAIGFAGALLPILVLVIIQSDNAGQTTTDLRPRIEEARALTKTRPKDAAAWRNLAQLLTDADRATEAIAPARRAITLAPRDFENTKILVEALKQGTQTEQALQELQKFTARNPQNSDGFLALGNEAFAASKYALAKLSYQAVLTRESQGSAAYDQALQGIALVDQAQAPTTTETPTAPERTTTGPVTP